MVEPLRLEASDAATDGQRVLAPCSLPVPARVDHRHGHVLLPVRWIPPSKRTVFRLTRRSIWAVVAVRGWDQHVVWPDAVLLPGQESAKGVGRREDVVVAAGLSETRR